MTRIDFYVLPEKGSDDARVTACKLCDRAVSSGHRVFINVPEHADREAIEKLLWSLRQGSFISHERYEGAALTEPLASVLLGTSEPPQSHTGVLINLAQEVPLYFSRFERVLEIVAGDEAQRGKSRERYKFYKDRGYALATHKL
jgi:DNA polymerase-3 subunit chi